MTAAAQLRAEALERAKRGDDAGAQRLFAQAVTQFPRDAALINSAGNYHAAAGRPVEALALFDRALSVMPGLAEAAINRAVVLTRLDRGAESAAYLRNHERRLATAPRYWTARASAEVQAGALAAAAASYDAGLAREAGNARALAGRARVALDRGEEAAAARYERALAVNPGDPQLLLGLAQALEAAGRRAEALAIGAALATQLPNWVDGLELYANLRWAAGDRAQFCDHYAAAFAQARDPAIIRSWAAMLAGVDRHGEAADILVRLRDPADRGGALALMEAICRGEAGDAAGAAAIFSAVPAPTADWQMSAARQLLRQGEPDAAERLLDRAIAAMPHDVTAWSLRDLCWRLSGDARHDWLHGQDGLIREMDLGLSAADFDAACQLLNRLHDAAAMPIGQSVKDGSQTRGALFQRTEPAIAPIAAAVRDTVERYRAALPPRDAGHPLLRHRDDRWQVAGSWSIRLSGAGRHASHIHPAGILSSAAYFLVPANVDDADRPGWLELGRPPASLGLDLPALARVRPRPGHCVLFPSTLYHGTRPIAAGRRMTVAFDVAPDGRA